MIDSPHTAAPCPAQPPAPLSNAPPVHAGENFLPAPLLQPRRWQSVKNLIWAMMGDKAYMACKHRQLIGRWPRITAPRTFNEYILHRMLIEKPDFTAHADKAQARQMVAAQYGESCVPARYLLTDDPRLPWDSLPHRFVVSATHGSAMTMIVQDKDTLDKNAAETVMASWLRHDFGHESRERFYSAIPPRLLVEENLTPEGKSFLPDYKFFCFGGEPICIQVDIDRFDRQSRTFYDTQWNLLPFGKGHVPPAPPRPRPARLEDMIAMAATLSRDFDFVRVDLYHVDPDRIVFGEWTFTPGRGLSPFQPDARDDEFGKKITALRARNLS